VIVIELVWNAVVPAEGLWEITVPGGWVDTAICTFT
jgi:hypothetical protein